MNNPLNKLKQEAGHIRLSHEEKEVMRAKLFATIDAAKYAPIPVPQAAYTWLSLRYAVLFGLVLVVALGGTAYAAEGALPGGVLYPVKLYVNESVAEVLAISPAAKISFHASRAEERLREAEVLAAEDVLDEAATIQIEKNFDTHVARADELTRELEQSDEGDALEARVRLESSLAAHGSILARLGRESRDEHTQENSTRVAERALARSSTTMQGSTLALKAAAGTEAMILAAPEDVSRKQEDENAPSEDEASQSQQAVAHKEVALRLKEKAIDALENVVNDFTEAEESLSAATIEQIQTELDALDEQMSGGEEQLKVKMFDVARETFTEVLRNALKIDALIEANGTYGRDFFHLEIEDETDDEEDVEVDEAKSEELELDIHINP